VAEEFPFGELLKNRIKEVIHSPEATLYFKLKGEHTPKGEVEKNYLVCYSTFIKKETSCKKIE
jgi:hypothetical protein